MPSFPEYDRQRDFTDYSTTNPATPHNGSWLDEEFDEIKRVLDEAQRVVNMIQRSDGQLANLSVGLDQLKPEIVLGTPTDWVTATDYEIKNVVWKDGILYVCNSDHTSDVFATDLAAELWTDYLDYADPLGDAQNYAAAANDSANDAAASASQAATVLTAAEAAQAAAEAAQAAAEAAIAAIELPLPIDQGGSGGTTAAEARTNFGLAIGTNVQAYSAVLAAYAAGASPTAAFLSLADDASVSALRTTLEVPTGTSGHVLGFLDGANTITGAQIFSYNTYTLFQGTSARLDLLETDATVDEGRWSIQAAGDSLQIIARNDGLSSSSTPMAIARTGVTIDSISLAATQILIPSGGAAAAPSLSVTGDTNTGVTFPSADNGTLAAAGTTAFQWSSGLANVPSTGRFRFGSGTEALPGLGIQADTDNGWFYIGANNFALSIAGVKAVDYSSTIISFVPPVQLKTPLSGETSGTLTVASSNKTVAATGDITINDGIHAAEDRIEIYAGASARAINQDTGMTLRLDGTSTTGNRTLAARGRASLYFVSSTEAVVSGVGVT